MPTFRRRVNVSQSVKGVMTFDCTVETEDGNLTEVLAESDAMVKELKVRYPVTGDEEKKK
jgi:hypothetical protein